MVWGDCGGWILWDVFGGKEREGVGVVISATLLVRSSDYGR